MLHLMSQFAIDGIPTSYKRHGHGHINDTYLLQTEKGSQYIFQRINPHVFHHIPELMHNIALVTSHIAKEDPDPRHSLSLIHTKAGSPYLTDADGEIYRMYAFIPNSICLEQAQSDEDFYQSAIAFGQFQNALADFPANSLHETIPLFHHTPNRYLLLHEAIQKDSHHRLNTVQNEVAFALEREKEASTMIDMQASGLLPLRVTHNDTKLNNVLFDEKTRKPLCVLDLDTVMPGLVGNDFGDSIRFGASTALEDEVDLSKVSFSLQLYDAYTKGFLTACGDRLSIAEIETLPLAAKLMTLECGVRFLTDYLSGDTYFPVERPNHNLDRARTQFKLVSEMETKWQAMHDIVIKYASR